MKTITNIHPLWHVLWYIRGWKAYFSFSALFHCLEEEVLIRPIDKLQVFVTIHINRFISGMPVWDIMDRSTWKWVSKNCSDFESMFCPHNQSVMKLCKNLALARPLAQMTSARLGSCSHSLSSSQTTPDIKSLLFSSKLANNHFQSSLHTWKMQIAITSLHGFSPFFNPQTDLEVRTRFEQGRPRPSTVQHGLQIATISIQITPFLIIPKCFWMI